MSLKGYKQSPEHIARRMAAWQLSPARAKNSERFRQLNISRTGQPMPEEQRRAIAVANKGKQNCLGHKQPLELRQRRSKMWKDNPKHNFWKDGKGYLRSGERRKEMGRLEYRLWRTAVFERDDYTCVLCGERGGSLCADHIKPWVTHPELRYSVDNGRTLCKNCHLETPTFGSNARKFSEENTSCPASTLV